MPQPTLTLQDLEGQNALTIIGTICRLLKKLDKEAGTNLEDEYRTKAMSGDYEHLWNTTVEYADQWLATTLRTSEFSETEVCWYCDGDQVSPDEEDEGDPCPECHGSGVSR